MSRTCGLVLVFALAGCGEAVPRAAGPSAPGGVPGKPEGNEPLPKKVVAALGHTCAIDAEGRVVCWGSNHSGQIGVGQASEAYLPPTVIGLAGRATHIGTRASHTCIVNEAGQVWCWGSNRGGVCGDPVDDIVGSPKRVPLLEGVRDIWIGSGQSCALTSSQEVWCWGDPALSDATKQPVPQRVPGLAHIASLPVGFYDPCAIDADGRGWCWKSGTVAPVTELSPLTAIGSGSAFTCALDVGRNVHCWGLNTQGVLGRPYRELQKSQNAVALPDVGRVAQLDVAQGYACARDDAGAVRCWGSNQYGQLGLAELEVHPKPVLIAGLPPAIDITAGGQGHACAIADDGGIYCWGYAQGGRLGIGTHVDISSAPDAVAGIEGAVHVATTVTRSCAIVGRDRRISCWGNPDNRPRMVEIAVPGARDVALAMTGCAIDAAGRVHCWDPRDDVASVVAGPVDAQELRADTFMFCARTGSGEVWCWGAPTKGGLVERFPPVRVAGLGRASRLAIDGTMGCAIVEGGVTCWMHTQEMENLVMQPVANVRDATKLIVGRRNCALAKGVLWCWDRQQWRAERTALKTAGAIVDIAGGFQHLCALMSDGKVACEGKDDDGQLGDGPKQGPGFGYVKDIADAVAIAAHGDHTCAIRRSGTVVCWGAPDPAARGPGDVVTTPVRVPMP